MWGSVFVKSASECSTATEMQTCDVVGEREHIQLAGVSRE